MRQLYKVIEKHKASFNYTFIAEKGVKVEVGKEDHEMPGWFWCKNTAGIEAWIPKTHLNLETGVLNQPYNSIEHNAKPGEIVQYIGESLEWIECLNSEWKYGWIPMSKLEKIED